MLGYPILEAKLSRVDHALTPISASTTFLTFIEKDEKNKVSKHRISKYKCVYV